MATLSKTGLTASYVYNDEGLRTQKTVNGVTTEYYWNGSQLIGQKTGNDYLHFLYDETGALLGFNNGAKTYIYTRNLQGDIIAITDTSTETVVATYTYDSWGNILTATGMMSETNPFRYRGYYYDTETGLYYLQIRYYDAEVGRFLNADSFVSTGQDLTGFNMYAYCGNNPVMYSDASGYSVFLTMLIMGIITGAAISGTMSGIRVYNEGQRGWGTVRCDSRRCDTWRCDGCIYSVRRRRWIGFDSSGRNDNIRLLINSRCSIETFIRYWG